MRKTAIDSRTTRHAGYAISQVFRKRIEEVFGWIEAQAGCGKVKVRGCKKAEAAFTFAVAAYNLIRLPDTARTRPCLRARGRGKGLCVLRSASETAAEQHERANKIDTSSAAR